MREVFWSSLAATVLFHATLWVVNQTVRYPLLRRRAARLVDEACADLDRQRLARTDRDREDATPVESATRVDDVLRRAALAEPASLVPPSDRLSSAADFYRRSTSAADQVLMRAEYHLREAALDDDEDAGRRLASAAAVYRQARSRPSPG